jgi:ATP-binding cassette subfamily B protein
MTASSKASEIVRRLRGTSGRGRRLRGLGALLAPYRVRTAAMILTLIGGTAASLAPAPLARYAIDDGIEAHDIGRLELIVAFFVLAAIIVWIATAAQTYLVEWVGQRALADLRLAIFAHLQRLPVSFYENRPTGVLISRMTNDVEALDSLVTDSVVTLFQGGLTLIGTLVILLTFDLRLALITFIMLPLIGLASLVFRITSTDAYRRTRETIGSITGYLQESLSGVRVVRSFAQEKRHEREFAALNERNRRGNMTTVHLNAAYFPAIEFVSAVATVLVLVYGGDQVLDGAIKIGVLVGFLVALNNFFDPITQLSQLYTTYQAGMAALDKIFELLDEQPSMIERADPLVLPRLRGELQFEHVSFSYQRARTDNGANDDDVDGELRPVLALDDIDLAIAPGETVALVGATGAGKSTFAKLVARFYDPTLGRVLIDGHDLRDVSYQSLRSQLGVVPQEAFLFSGTIRSNIAFGRPEASDEEIVTAARAAGADEFIRELADGYGTEVGERGVQLSAGQRQLVAFARALIADPRILVLDEATSNVDLRTEARIEQGLRRLLAGRTAIVIAHRLSTIRNSSRIVVLERGRVAEQGTHDELLAARGVYWSLYQDWSGSAEAA